MRFPYLFLLSACALMFALPLIAQSTNGVINGLVVDPSNRIISGADILAINDGTGVRYSGKTNDDGIYVVPNLPPGAYRLQVSKVGFKTLIKPDVVLNLQDALSINFTLPVGAAIESVTVEGGVSMINTTDASVSTVVDQSYVQNMPLNGRSFQDLIMLTPGIVTNSPQDRSTLGQSGEFSVNGQRTESNNYTVDGVGANVGMAAGFNGFGAGASGSVPASTALGTTQALVSVDDLQEFRVQSSSYSAEYGRNPGGQFAFQTKSGSDQWHSTAYDYLRNGIFDAPDYFTDYFRLLNPYTINPATKQNDFGGTFGGPVTIPSLYNGRGKTFFFVSYEGLRLTQPQPTSATYVPDLCMRAMGPCPIVMRNGISVQRAPAASALLPAMNAFPLPSINGLEDAVNGIGQFIGSWSNPSSIDSSSVRFDHVVNDKLRLFFRFSNTASSSASRGAGGIGSFGPTINTTSAYTMQTYTAGATSVFSSRLSNELRLNYSSNAVSQDEVIDPFGGSTPVNLAQLSSLGSGEMVTLTLYFGAIPGIQQQSQSGSQKQWNLVDTLSFSFGRHQFRLGADYRRLAPFTNYPTYLSYYFLSEPDVETNGALTFAEANIPAYPLYRNFSAFAQDEWKLAHRLSLSFGLRWEVNPAPGATRGLMPYTIEGSSPDTWTLAPQGTSLWQTTWFNFAPRLGVAYILRNTPGSETVVRAGGGLFFDTGQQTGSYGFSGPGFSTYSMFLPGAFPADGPSLIPVIVNPPVAPYSATLYGFATHLQLPYTLQWNVSIEQAVGKAQALTASYVGSHAARLLKQNELQVADNPNANLFILTENGLTSDYNALQVQFRRRLSRGLTALASYTWSHCIDYGSSNLDLGYQRGNCDFDLRHNLSAAFSYDLPNVGHSGFLDAVLYRWGLDGRLTARTAFPVPLTGNALLQPNGQTYYAGLDLVPGQTIYLYGANCATVLQGLGDLQPGQTCPGGRAINPQAFTSVSSGYGDAPRNSARGFDAIQMDLAVRREFPIYEKLKLQFRAETFNVFNRPNFGIINTHFGQQTFGQATSTLAGSLGVLSPLYQQGGPRSMQFALKLIF
jgi:hypothetical protein